LYLTLSDEKDLAALCMQQDRWINGQLGGEIKTLSLRWDRGIISNTFDIQLTNRGDTA